GTYRVRARASRLLDQRARVGPGDSLVLELSAGAGQGGRLGFRRTLYALSHNIRSHVVRDQQEGGWLLAGIQNQRAGDGLEMTATLEKRQAGPQDVIGLPRPRLPWFEVPDPKAPDDPHARPPRMRVESVADYPAPAWRFRLPEWDRVDAP